MKPTFLLHRFFGRHILIYCECLYHIMFLLQRTYYINTKSVLYHTLHLRHPISHVQSFAMYLNAQLISHMNCIDMYTTHVTTKRHVLSYRGSLLLPTNGKHNNQFAVPLLRLVRYQFAPQVSIQYRQTIVPLYART